MKKILLSSFILLSVLSFSVCDGLFNIEDIVDDISNNNEQNINIQFVNDSLTILHQLQFTQNNQTIMILDSQFDPNSATGFQTALTLDVPLTISYVLQNNQFVNVDIDLSQIIDPILGVDTYYSLELLQDNGLCFKIFRRDNVDMMFFEDSGKIQLGDKVCMNDSNSIMDMINILLGL